MKAGRKRSSRCHKNNTKCARTRVAFSCLCHFANCHAHSRTAYNSEKQFAKCHARFANCMPVCELSCPFCKLYASLRTVMPICELDCVKFRDAVCEPPCPVCKLHARLRTFHAHVQTVFSQAVTIKKYSSYMGHVSLQTSIQFSNWA